MYQQYKGLYKVHTEKILGFGGAVRRLGTHMVCGSETYYRPEFVRSVLQGKFRSKRMLELIGHKVPEMFDVCNVCDDVKSWWNENKARIEAEVRAEREVA